MRALANTLTWTVTILMAKCAAGEHTKSPDRFSFPRGVFAWLPELLWPNFKQPMLDVRQVFAEQPRRRRLSGGDRAA